ncbi:MAG: ABC transporter permease, partial [Verrucomicrobia bacterium]|nr:ABC transporter permease [Verrucomicrobiota bacterium]
MRIFATVRISVRALRRNTLRSVLTALGIIIGVGAVIAMVGIGNGAKAQMEAQIASLGDNVILIWSGSVTRSGLHTGWGSAGTLTLEDVEAMKREVPGIVAVSPEVRTVSQVAAGNQNWYTQVLGEGPEYFDIRRWPLAEGSVFTALDVRGATKTAVIGETVAQQLFGDEDPLGQI